jgi:hypothetical protein
MPGSVNITDSTGMEVDKPQGVLGGIKEDLKDHINRVGNTLGNGARETISAFDDGNEARRVSKSGPKQSADD